MISSNSFQRWMLSALMCGVGAMGLCRADTIFLTDGREVSGTIVNEDNQTVVIKTTRGTTRSIRRAEIETIVREKAKVVEKAIPKTVDATNAPVVPVKPGAPPTSGDIVGSKPIAPVTPSETSKTPDAGVSSKEAPSSPIVNAPPTSTRDLATSTENPMPGFPEGAKRMSSRKEALFRDAMETIKASSKNLEDASRGAAISDIQALGSEAVPYLWAGVQNDNAEVRTACMKLIGVMNGRTCTKRVIETFYMTMPESSAAAIWNVPFVEETIRTVTSITGQSFVTVEARRVGVQDGLKKYLEWYKDNFKTIPRQIGEPEIDPNDKDYESKLTKARELKLSKREWAHAGELPASQVAGPNKTAPEKPPTPVIKDAEREADKKYAQTVPTVDDDKALKRPTDKPGIVEDDQAYKRGVDRRNEQSPSAPQRRDPPSDGPGQSSVPEKDPFQRPQDAVRQQRQ